MYRCSFSLSPSLFLFCELNWPGLYLGVFALRELSTPFVHTLTEHNATGFPPDTHENKFQAEPFQYSALQPKPLHP